MEFYPIRLCGLVKA